MRERCLILTWQRGNLFDVVEMEVIRRDEAVVNMQQCSRGVNFCYLVVDIAVVEPWIQR